MGRLDDGDEDAITFDLLRGQTYMIMGVCDADCSDLDLVLYDGDGDEVDSDLATDDVPIVSVATDRADTYRVEISMVSCSAEPCRFGVGVYGGTGSSGTATASKGTGTGSAPNWQAAPTYGTIDLDAGFTPDPYERAISAGGDDEVDLSATGCSGFIHAEAPDLDRLDRSFTVWHRHLRKNGRVARQGTIAAGSGFCARRNTRHNVHRPTRCPHKCRPVRCRSTNVERPGMDNRLRNLCARPDGSLPRRLRSGRHLVARASARAKKGRPRRTQRPPTAPPPRALQDALPSEQG
jgi:hypothetical protein